MEIKDLIKSINILAEDITSEDVLQDTPEQEPEVAPEFNDGMSLADTFDAKAKIARCLENLKQAVEDFKEATAEKVDLLKDELLLEQIEKLDVTVKDIEVALASGSNILGNSELNDAFKTELPAEEETETKEEENSDDSENEDSDDEDEIEEDEDEVGEYDFDDQAGLDLFNPED